MTVARLAIAAALAACSAKQPQRTVRVAAAADLVRVFDELVPAFTAKTGIRPVVDFAASGVLARRIADGAPYALFAAASEAFVADAVAGRRCDPASVRAYARGRVAVWSPANVAAPESLDALADPRFRRLAVADPERAPYGRAARQALDNAGVWASLQDRLVVVDDVYAALQAARDHRVDAALVSLSLTVVGDGGGFLSVDPTLYEPLDQMLATCGSGDDPDAAHELASFLASPEAQEVFARYGFAPPSRAAIRSSAGARR